MAKWIARDATDAELAYAAGALDGEGCIHIGGRPGRVSRKGVHATWLTVSLCNTDPRMPLKMKDIFGGNFSRTRESRNNRMACFNWLLSGRPAGEALRRMMPYLIIKREQAEIAIAYAETISRKGNLAPGIQEKRREHLARLRDLKSWRPEVVDFHEVMDEQMKGVAGG